MVTCIGIVSGELLTLLENLQKELSLDEIEFYLEEPYELVLMSVGWLARQGMVHIERDEHEEFIVSLMEDSVFPARLKNNHRSRLPL